MAQSAKRPSPPAPLRGTPQWVVERGDRPGPISRGSRRVRTPGRQYASPRPKFFANDYCPKPEQGDEIAAGERQRRGNDKHRQRDQHAAHTQPAFLRWSMSDPCESCQQCAGDEQLERPGRLQCIGQPPRGKENGRDGKQRRHGRSQINGQFHHREHPRGSCSMHVGSGLCCHQWQVGWCRAS